MLVRNGRNQVEDWGPHRTLDASNMKMAGASGTTGTGRWSNAMMTIVIPKPPPEPKPIHEYQRVQLDERCAADDCDRFIVTAQPSLAIYCSTKCRNRMAKRRQDARRKTERGY